MRELCRRRSPAELAGDALALAQAQAGVQRVKTFLVEAIPDIAAFENDDPVAGEDGPMVDSHDPVAAFGQGGAEFAVEPSEAEDDVLAGLESDIRQKSIKTLRLLR